MKTDNLLSIKECNDIIKLSEEMEWVYKKSDNYSFKRCFFRLPSNIENKILKYTEETLKIKLKTNVLSFAVLKYEKGDSFGRHMDRFQSTEFNKDFVYNINLKLNKNYEGGKFYHLDKEFSPNIGDVYYYNSTDYHEVKPIKSGTRYTGLIYIRERDLKDNYKSII